jgi:hypothetical protein
MMRRRLAWTVTGIAAAVALAGCGGASSGTTSTAGATPSSRLENAFTNLTSTSSLSATLSLGQSGQTLAKLATAGGSMTPAQARALAGLQLRVILHSPSGTLRSLSATNTPDVDFAILDAGTPYTEIRVVGGNLYLQAKVRQALQLLGQPADVFGNLQAELSHGPAFLKALLRGRWIELSKAELTQLQSLLGTTGVSPSPSLSPGAAHTFEQDLQDIYTKDLTVTEANPTATGGDYTLTGNTRAIATDFLKDFTAVLPQALSSQITPKIQTDQIPSKTLSLQATVANNVVNQVSFDVGQLAPPSQAGLHAAIDLGLSTASATVAAPAHAVPVDLSALGSMFSQMFSGSASAAVTS